MNYKQKVGKFGEEIAINYLIKQGYKIINKNIKTSYQEIDIVARQGETIVFIEVKTRISRVLGSAVEAMTARKTENFKKAIGFYIYENNLDENYIRADLISVDIDKNSRIAKIKHYRDVI